jgi:hypothetical protein
MDSWFIRAASLYKSYYLTSSTNTVYFFKTAGGVVPAESPLSAAYTAFSPSSSSIRRSMLYLGRGWSVVSQSSSHLCRGGGLECIAREEEWVLNGGESGDKNTYLATLSLLAGAPVLIWPTPRATTRSAMIVFSVSPERCETITPHPSD